MASAGAQEQEQQAPPPTAPALSIAGDATGHGGLDNKTGSNVSNDSNDSNDSSNGIISTGANQDNSPLPVSNTASASASATASPSPSPVASNSPARVVSDIPADVPPPPPRPPPSASAAVSLPPLATAAVHTASVASPASSASPSVHGLGARSSLASRSNTPHRSPALPSPPVPLRASPAPSRPLPAATQPAPTPRASDYQNSPVWRPTQPPRSYRKAPIPPAPATAPAPTPAAGFPSPGRDRSDADPKFLDDKTRITHGIQQATPAAVRRAVRDNWEKCLVGSDFHQAFILNASIHHATPAAVQRGMRDFGRAMVSAARSEIVDAMTPSDIDAVAARLLAKASDSFLDAALELRLKSIDAKRLINALARAERLGYEPSDVVAEEDDPTADYPTAQHERGMPAPTPPQPIAQPAPQPDASAAAPLYCKLCFRKFNHQSAFDHHVKGRVCTRTPISPGGFKFSCQHCGQGFTTVMGVQYHNANKVCGDFGDPFKVDPAPVASTPTAPRAKGPAPSTPAPLPTPASTSTSTPASAHAAARPSPSEGHPRMGTPGLHTPNGAVGDPYAHLSPEQLAAMQEELRLAELSYGERFRQANMIEDAAERKTRLDGLSNSFGTKQSLIRKKYGVRLRLRRTKAEIQAERDRMQYKTAAELAADIGITSAPPGRPARQGIPTHRPASIIARGSNGGTGTMWSSVNRPGATAPQAPMSTLASELMVPNPTPGDPRATDVSMHGGNKRRFSGSGASSGSKRVAYTEMGGLSGGAAADAETMDPTLPPVAGARAASASNVKGQGTAEEPMALDDTDTESDDSGDDDEDIPAELPASVRQSLQQGSPSVTPGPQP